MKDKMLTTTTCLVLCPSIGGPGATERVCALCPYQNQNTCANLLRDSALELLGTYSAENAVQRSLKVQVSEVLHELGVPAHVLGYSYLRHAIILTVQEPGLIRNITWGLYPKVAKKFDTTPTRVERAIRHAIELAWERGDLRTLQHWFGWSISDTRGKSTNSEFIALIADKLRLELQKEDM